MYVYAGVSGAVFIPREIFVRSLVSYCEEPQVYSLKLDLQSLAWKKKSFSLLAFLNNLEKVIHAFITSRLDYCSSLYIRLGEALLSLLCTCSKMLLVNRLLTSGWKHFTHAGIVTLATCTVHDLFIHL